MSHTKKYFIQEHLQEPYLNGGIGYTDIEKILLQHNYQPLFFPCHYSFSFIAKLRRLLYLIKIFITLPSDSIVVFLHPQYASLNKALVKLLLRRGSIRLAAIVGDINGIKHNKPALLQQELQQFAKYDYLIVHNAGMQKWMEQQIAGVKCSAISFFDFLAQPATRIAEQTNIVVYAGNLEEALFLENLPQSDRQPVTFEVYGQPFTSGMQRMPNLQYMGVSAPYSLSGRVGAAYGLVWYGPDTHRVSGNIGPYLKLISPHKASLYLLCGIPLLVPVNTALADLVQQHGIGLTISSLDEIGSRIAAINADQFNAMCANVKRTAGAIAAGKGLSAALAEMEKALSRGLQQ